MGKDDRSKAKRPRKPRLPASAIEIPGMPASIMFPGADFKNKSKLEQQELALLGPGLDALMGPNVGSANSSWLVHAVGLRWRCH